MTPEEEEEAFKSFKYSKEEDAEETPAGNYAEGYTYEDMVEAMKAVPSGVTKTKPIQRECMKSHHEHPHALLSDNKKLNFSI